jgi:hypothetical protein
VIEKNILQNDGKQREKEHYARGI